MKNPKQTSLRWLKEAVSTLESARKIFSRNEDYNLVCFLSEQASQKALKGVAYFDGARTVPIHSIRELLKLSSEKHSELSGLMNDGAKLDQYYLSTRYPDAVAEPAIPSEIFSADQAGDSLKIAEKIFSASKKIIGG